MNQLCIHFRFCPGLAWHHQLQSGWHSSARNIDIDWHCVDHRFRNGTTKESNGELIVGHVAQCHRSELVHADAVCGHNAIGVHNRRQLASLLVDASEQCRLHTIHHYRIAFCDNFFIAFLNIDTEIDVFEE